MFVCQECKSSNQLPLSNVNIDTESLDDASLTADNASQDDSAQSTPGYRFYGTEIIHGAPSD